MANDFVPNPWLKGPYIDRTYPSGTASARPKLTPRIHCIPDYTPGEGEEMSGPKDENMVERFNRQLRAGHAEISEGDE